MHFLKLVIFRKPFRLPIKTRSRTLEGKDTTQYHVFPPGDGPRVVCNKRRKMYNLLPRNTFTTAVRKFLGQMSRSRTGSRGLYLLTPDICLYRPWGGLSLVLPVRQCRWLYDPNKSPEGHSDTKYNSNGATCFFRSRVTVVRKEGTN